MAAAAPCTSHLASGVMARPMVNVPRCPENQSHVQLMSAVSALPEKHGDSAVSVHVDENAVGRRGDNRAMQRRPQSGVLDFSPFRLMDPFSPMKTMRQMLDTMDSLFEDSMMYHTAKTRRSESDGSLEMRTPWDIMEDDKEVKLRFDMSGLSKAEVKVSVQDDMLVIKGEHKKEGGSEEKGDEWWQERSVSSYNMQMVLLDECDQSKIAAEFRNGILLVTVLKKEVVHKVVDVGIGMCCDCSMAQYCRKILKS